MIDTPIQWVSAVTRSCVQMISGKKDIEYNAEEYRKAYHNFSNRDRCETHQLLLSQFEVEDSVWVLSYIIKILQMDEFQIDASQQICRGKYDFATRIMLEIQLKELPYEAKRKVHKKNFKMLMECIKPDFRYVPVARRKQRRIVIITEQLLNLQHAPTRMTLEIAYTFQKKFKYDVEVFTCASNKMIPNWQWVSTWGFNSGNERHFEIVYKDSIIPVYQYPLSDCSIEDYCQMLSLIYKFKPLFVLEMGVCNPVADLPHVFTTTVNFNTVTEAPVSEADIFIRHTRLEESIEDMYEKNMTSYQKQIFMKQVFPALFSTGGTGYTRKDLHLPEDRFLIAVVGNRLDQEISETFEKFMMKILQENDNVDFVIIGEVTELQHRLNNKVFDKRLYYMGYCTDLKGVLGVLDLYLNPDRLGGGWSGAIALHAGVPVVALPKGDVAYNISEKFVVSNYEEMYGTICRYMRDPEFYNKQKQDALQYAKEHSENKIIDFLDEMLKRIKEILLND